MRNICIECGQQTASLYKDYGSKGSIMLSQCESCSCFVDKYLEFDLIVIFMDLILLKKQAYRHMIFNRLRFSGTGLNVCDRCGLTPGKHRPSIYPSESI